VKRPLHLLYPKRPTGAWAPVFAGVILIAAAAVGMAELPQPRLRLVTPDGQARAAESSPYKHWLDGPVSYIISPRERKAFEKLTSDEERDMFIQQFWERRNPNPGSGRNAFKEEFYRRVKYADAHFAVGYPGWKSDRGHLYLLYGPPDEIHSYPHAVPCPYEEWFYNRIPSIGANVFVAFVDKRGEGDYQLALRPWKDQ
jgi:GWxTD domain-containing protein